MTLYGKGNITLKQIQQSVEASTAFNEVVTNSISQNFDAVLKTLPPTLNQECSREIAKFQTLLQNLAAPFAHLETGHLRIEQFKKLGLIMPLAYTLGARSDSMGDGNQRMVSTTMQYVPIIATLTSALHPHKRAIKSSDGLLRDYIDGMQYAKDKFFMEHPDALQLTLYNDDIEIANPLGSKAGVHKLTMFYMSVKGVDQSSLSNIHLVAVVNSADLKLYGYNQILQPLYHDLDVLGKGYMRSDGTILYGKVKVSFFLISRLGPAISQSKQSIVQARSNIITTYYAFVQVIPAEAS